ncbi:hypothetical protein NM688_g2101 [Phlebia brevispora]|uniref:Uncharacterized protein n=1 Tax=Phlebia brevispora TaxID=194682 RepID=A0ACC1TA80_9APHY|nr:hypothetical protein NM688_g2101 [Phlebia brevispora]
MSFLPYNVLTSAFVELSPHGEMDVVSLVATRQTDRYLATSITALQVYDYLLTFPKEIRCIWARRFTGATAIFLTMRYVPLISAVFTVLQGAYCSNPHASCSTCNVLSRTLAVSTIFPITSLGRGKDLTKAILVLMLILIEVCLNAYVDLVPRWALPDPSLPIPGCVQNYGHLEKLVVTLYTRIQFTPEESPNSPILGFVGTSCSVLAELIVQVVTWVKTADVKRTLKRLNMERPLITLLLRSGAVLSALCRGRFLAAFSTVTQSVSTKQDLTVLNLPFLSILMCRFMLELRQIYLSDGALEGETSQAISIPPIVVGNLGASLDIGSPQDVVFDHLSIRDIEPEDDLILVSNDPLASGLRLP